MRLPAVLFVVLSASGVIADDSVMRDVLPSVDTDALARAIQRCWQPPSRAQGPAVEVQVRLTIGADGRLEAAPRVDHMSDDPYHQRVTASVVRAIQACAPYRSIGPVRDVVVSFRSP